MDTIYLSESDLPQDSRTLERSFSSYVYRCKCNPSIHPSMKKRFAPAVELVADLSRWSLIIFPITFPLRNLGNSKSKKHDSVSSCGKSWALSCITRTLDSPAVYLLLCCASAARATFTSWCYARRVFVQGENTGIHQASGRDFWNPKCSKAPSLYACKSIRQLSVSLQSRP